MSGTGLHQPIIDSHFHLWPAEARLGTLVAAVGTGHGMAWPDYAAATQGWTIDGAVAVEVDRGTPLDEVAFFEGVAEEAPTLKGIVAHAALEHEDIDSLLQELATRKMVSGVRRVTQNEADPMFCAHPAFRANVAQLGALGLTCDVCVKDFQLPGVIALADACPDTTIILDHLGKPDVGAGKLGPWREDLARLAERTNVHCKMSVVVHGWETDAWTETVVAPVVDHAITCFGYDRLLFASNWPVSTAVTGYGAWLSLAFRLTSGASPDQRAALFRDNAVSVYGLQM